MDDMGAETGKYLAFSYFYDVIPEFVASYEPTVAEIEAAAKQVCSSTLKDLKAKHSTYESHNPEFIRRACQVCALVPLVTVYQQGQHTSHALGAGAMRVDPTALACLSRHGIFGVLLRAALPGPIRP